MENRPGARVGALVTWLAGWVLVLLPVGNGLVHYSFDLPVLLGPKASCDEVLIIHLDEPSLTELSQAYQSFDRTLHAQLLRRLTAGHAALVVFDVYFPESDPRPNDAELAEAIRAHGRVVLAADYSPLPGLIGGETGPPLRVLREAAAGWGLSVLTRDTDAIVRRHDDGTEDFPSLPWIAAKAAGATAVQDERLRLQTRWLKFCGGDRSMPTLSYYLALQAPPEQFTGKYVFVGGKPKTRFLHDETDEFPTSHTHLGGPFMSGVEIHATTFLNLVRGEWLNRIAPERELLLLALAGIVLGISLAMVRPLPGLAVASAVLVLTSAVACLLFWHADFWFSWLILVGAQVPCAWISAVVWNTQKLYRHKTARERDARDLPGAASGTAFPSPGPLMPPAAPSQIRSGATRVVASIPDFALIRRIGQGAYGEVYLARNAIGLLQAVKVIYRDKFASADPYEREFHGIQRYMPVSLNHPSLVRLLHVGRNDDAGYFYYVMELGDDAVTGTEIDPLRYAARTLAGELPQPPGLPCGTCVPLFVALTEALHYLHLERLVHRDIKPSNIIFVRGIPKFADIGLVTGVAERGHEVSYVGTEGYIAPEGPGTPAADVFSLGRVLYEAVTGLHWSKFPELPDLSAGDAEWPIRQQLHRIACKACEEEVGRRYRSAEEMHLDLRQLQTM
ncbi:MAG: CHASE2 domain-containing protein [Verrucomicrobia bacterium]|nr:CHASE2 domain-containing protein [Verrucomicrobiota bacterium]